MLDSERFIHELLSSENGNPIHIGGSSSTYRYSDTAAVLPENMFSYEIIFEEIELADSDTALAVYFAKDSDPRVFIRSQNSQNYITFNIPMEASIDSSGVLDVVWGTEPTWKILWDTFLFPKLMKSRHAYWIINNHRFNLPISPTVGVFATVIPTWDPLTNITTYGTDIDGTVEIFHTAISTEVTLSELRRSWTELAQSKKCLPNNLGSAAELDSLDLDKTELNGGFKSGAVKFLDPVTTLLYGQTAAEHLLAPMPYDAPDLGWNKR